MGSSPAQRSLRIILVVAIIASAMMRPAASQAQTETLPGRLPYFFSNAVWWDDSELRALLKRRIPGLGEEIPPTLAAEGRIRDALLQLLSEKGVASAIVQIEDPSPWSLTAQHAPGAPPPSIVFRIQAPEIVVSRVTVTGAPKAIQPQITKDLALKEGGTYSALQDWSVRAGVSTTLENNGYLTSSVRVEHGPPTAASGRYLVPLLVSIDAGPQFHIASLTADGGPLLQGSDLVSVVRVSPGAIAAGNPFGRLAGQIRALYWQHGYSDVAMSAPPQVDREHASVSYHFTVVPGPLYHLRTLKIANLEPKSEARARELLGLNPGDIFNALAIDALNSKLSSDPLLDQYGFTFTPTKDAAASQVDLLIKFYKKKDSATVTAH